MGSDSSTQHAALEQGRIPGCLRFVVTTSRSRYEALLGAGMSLATLTNAFCPSKVLYGWPAGKMVLANMDEAAAMQLKARVDFHLNKGDATPLLLFHSTWQFSAVNKVEGVLLSLPLAVSGYTQN